MEKRIITEIVSFELIKEIAEKEFENVVNELELKFHMKQTGYLDSELLKGKKKYWSMVMHWETMTDVKNASKLLMCNSEATDFKNMINPKTVKIQYLEQIKKWHI